MKFDDCICDIYINRVNIELNNLENIYSCIEVEVDLYLSPLNKKDNESDYNIRTETTLFLDELPDNIINRLVKDPDFIEEINFYKKCATKLKGKEKIKIYNKFLELLPDEVRLLYEI